MTRRTQTRAGSLTEALQAAIAELVGCDPQKVDLQVAGPGVEDLSGSLRLDLEVGSAQPQEASPTAEPATERTQEPPAAEPAAGHTPENVRSTSDDEVTPEQLDEEADAAADFLEGLLDALDLPGDLRIRIKEDHAEVEIAEVGSGALIGRRGQTLEAIQELVRCAMQRQFERRSRVQIDVEGYRARRLEKLLEKADEAIDAVLDSGEAQRLEPMDVFERKAVHQLVADVEGLTSRSQGREPGRRIVIEAEG